MSIKEELKEFFPAKNDSEGAIIAVAVAGLVLAFVICVLGIVCGAAVGLVCLFKALFLWSLWPLLTVLLCVAIIAVCVGALSFILYKLGKIE